MFSYCHEVQVKLVEFATIEVREVLDNRIEELIPCPS